MKNQNQPGHGGNTPGPQEQNSGNQGARQHVNNPTGENQPGRPGTEREPDRSVRTGSSPEPGLAGGQKGGQGGYSADPEREQVSREQEDMNKERDLDDLDIDRQQTGLDTEDEDRDRDL